MKGKSAILGLGHCWLAFVAITDVLLKRIVYIINMTKWKSLLFTNPRVVPNLYVIILSMDYKKSVIRGKKKRKKNLLHILYSLQLLHIYIDFVPFEKKNDKKAL